MRIAQIAPLCEAVPPRLYGGTERVVAYLTDELVALGHQVTLFASGDSVTRAQLVAARAQALRLDPQPLKSDVAVHLAMLHDVHRRADDFDVLHFHIDLLPLPIFTDCADRTVTTLHGRLDIADLPPVYERWPQYGLVSISDAQRRPLPSAHWLATVHHGLPENLMRFRARPERYLAFVGRVSPEKRLDRAIAIAERAHTLLRIGAKVDPADAHYFVSDIEPLLDRSRFAEFVGEVDDEAKSELIGHAKALVFPIDWPEPFGLVMIEAMACGTPVIAWDCGAVPEVVEEGVTGFIVHSEEEAIAAIERLDSLDRALIRQRFEQRFSARTMASRYIDVYRRLQR